MSVLGSLRQKREQVMHDGDRYGGGGMVVRGWFRLDGEKWLSQGGDFLFRESLFCEIF